MQKNGMRELRVEERDGAVLYGPQRNNLVLELKKEENRIAVCGNECYGPVITVLQVQGGPNGRAFRPPRGTTIRNDAAGAGDDARWRERWK